MGRHDIIRGTPEEIANLKVGDTLYHFDGNLRVYDKPHSGPVYEKHFTEVKIVGETKLSWVMPYEHKANKKTLSSSCQFAERGYFTKTGMEIDIWDHDHRWKIIKSAEHASFEQLKEIARIIGYSDKTETE